MVDEKIGSYRTVEELEKLVPLTDTELDAVIKSLAGLKSSPSTDVPLQMALELRKSRAADPKPEPIYNGAWALTQMVAGKLVANSCEPNVCYGLRTDDNGAQMKVHRNSSFAYMTPVTLSFLHRIGFRVI